MMNRTTIIRRFDSIVTHERLIVTVSSEEEEHIIDENNL
jgi:hypothetical protein